MKTKKAKLVRLESSNQGTLGIFLSDAFICRTIELPWRNNIRDKSCIPLGIYDVTLRNSPKFGDVYWIQHVDGRSWILVHYGNLAGNVDIGYKTHTEGCVCVGKYHGKLNGQDAVLLSKITLIKLMNYMKKEDFVLEVINA